MKYILSLCVGLFACTSLFAQHTIRLLIKNGEDPLAGATATISSINKTAVADSNGIATFENILTGRYVVHISYTGMAAQEITVSAPQEGNAAVQLSLTENEEEAVIVTSTRISRSISDIPTRVETISGEELSEKENMKPGDIRMLLNESTGIQTQQTSATSYNSSIRIQGLDGRYTQILRDGFPLYAGFSGGLSLMQVAPLDLKQIEVIKGAASTLYGGGAIAGLVNLVSKTPAKKRELSFIANGTSAGGLDLSGFYSQKFKQFGLTVFGSRNSNKAYDPAGIGLTAIPRFRRYTIAPRLFIYGQRTNADIGFAYMSEDRTGGSMDYINKGAAGYFESNFTERFTPQVQVTHKINDRSQLNFKSSLSIFNRSVRIPLYYFSGIQHSFFSEAAYSRQQEKMQWVFGANFLADNFTEQKINNIQRDYHHHTVGGFLQNTWSPVKRFTVETGLRGDYVNEYGFELLPRVALLFRPAPLFTARLGGGTGYKTPTIFNEEAERIQFRDIQPIDPLTNVNERSAGASFDMNYRTRIGDVGFTVNQLFFYTKLNTPLILVPLVTGYGFVNANGHIDTRGMETNVRLAYEDFKLFIGYTYADVESHFNGTKSWFPLTARHRLNNVLMYEKEGKLKIGAEAYYFSRQKLSDGIGKPYWTFGLLGERTWTHFSIFLNFENFTDTRQTKFDTIYTGSVNAPAFRDIYAPVDGFVVNGGIKVKL
jgi:iron complex outermembrane receptor protein